MFEHTIKPIIWIQIGFLLTVWKRTSRIGVEIHDSRQTTFLLRHQYNWQADSQPPRMSPASSAASNTAWHSGTACHDWSPLYHHCVFFQDQYHWHHVSEDVKMGTNFPHVCKPYRFSPFRKATTIFQVPSQTAARFFKGKKMMLGSFCREKVYMFHHPKVNPTSQEETDWQGTVG